MEWVLWILVVAVLGLGAIVASGRWGELPATVSDAPRPHVPEGVLTGDDLLECRLDVVMRGYSMTQVDELLDRLSAQLGVSPDRQHVLAGLEPILNPVPAEPVATAAKPVPPPLDESLFVPVAAPVVAPDPGPENIEDSYQWRARLAPARRTAEPEEVTGTGKME